MLAPSALRYCETQAGFRGREMVNACGVLVAVLLAGQWGPGGASLAVDNNTTQVAELWIRASGRNRDWTKVRIPPGDFRIIQLRSADPFDVKIWRHLGGRDWRESSQSAVRLKSVCANPWIQEYTLLVRDREWRSVAETSTGIKRYRPIYGEPVDSTVPITGGSGGLNLRIESDIGYPLPKPKPKPPGR